jgi:predicted transcriptional regulator
MRTATIIIRKPGQSLVQLRGGFVKAWKSRKYGGEHFEFQSPAALFQAITPKRWELIETLQAAGPISLRALARELGRDVKRVHDDVRRLIEIGLIERTDKGKLSVPFDEIHTDFILRPAA